MSSSRSKPLLLVGVAFLPILAILLFARDRYDVDVPLTDMAVEDKVPLFLIHGYGGDPASMRAVERLLEERGRHVVSVALPRSGRGDIVASARGLGEIITEEGASEADVVGFSAGGLVARTFVRQGGGDANVRFLVFLGTPHHGTRLAGLATAFDRSLCARACRQMIPGSRFLRTLNSRDEGSAGTASTNIYSADDGVVTPPESARLAGVRNIRVQDLCPGAQVPHSRLVTDPIALGLVVDALDGGLGIDAESCDDVRQLGTVPEN
ncbi:MAG: esterase/lipase family protein [Actinomycetota bacterium]